MINSLDGLEIIAYKYDDNSKAYIKFRNSEQSVKIKISAEDYNYLHKLQNNIIIRG